MEEQTKEQGLQNIASVVTTFDSKTYIERIKSDIKEGRVDPLAAFIVVKRMFKVGEDILQDKEIKAIALAEAEKHLSANTKTFSLYSATISKAATYTWYDFTECGHPVLEQLKKIEEEVKLRIKLLEDELKLLILSDSAQMTLGVKDDTKTIKVEKIPFLRWEDTEDEVVVRAPQKMQQIGLKFNKV